MGGGGSYISKKYSKANNKYLKPYDPKQEVKHIIYSDTNNVYGYVMCNVFPTSKITWKDPQKFDISKYGSNSSKGCILELNLEYPKELFKLHDYPSAPDEIKTKKEMLNYQLKIADFHNLPFSNVKKLLPNFFDKQKYVLHYEQLQLYLRLALKFKKIHRVLQFNHSQWLKPYVKFNTYKTCKNWK